MKDKWWFQPRALQNVRKDFDMGARAVCLVSPPGSGKTEMAAVEVPKYKRPACVVHTLALQRNALTRLCETYTVQHILAAGGFPKGKVPDFLIWDECHHSAGEVWGSILDMVPKSTRVLGLTGTPQRSDGRALDRFDTMVVAAHYSELLMSGTIVPYRCLHPKAFRDDADPDPALAYQRYGEGKKAIFYCKSVAQADDVTKSLKGIGAAWHSEIAWKDRDKTLKQFERNELRCLVTVDALTEGVDVPDASCIVLASKCHNVSSYLQKTGRGGRSKRGKPEALLIDLSGAHLRHGPPTIDREYSITGSGIMRKHGAGGHSWVYERGPREPKDLGAYDAELVVGYDWRAPSRKDKRRQLGWLRELAGRRGWSKEVAEQAFAQLFGAEEDVAEAAQ